MVLILKRLINCDVQIRFKAENFAKPIAEKWNSEEKVMVKEREAKATVMVYGGNIFQFFCITRVRRRSSSWPTR